MKSRIGIFILAALLFVGATVVINPPLPLALLGGIAFGWIGVMPITAYQLNHHV